MPVTDSDSAARGTAKTRPVILTINAGSSSIKFALFQPGASLRRLVHGAIERIGLTGTLLVQHGIDDADEFSRTITAVDHASAAAVLMESLRNRLGRRTLAAVGHRVVHGGPRHSDAQPVTPELLRELRELIPLDPQHLPQQIALIEALRGCTAGVPHVACFDTAFHHDMPAVAQLLAIPRRYAARGLRRYGFHGLSYAYLMEELARIAGTSISRRRIVLAHLGNGASLAAVHEGRSVDTTMGFTPAGGVMMSTRSGDIDPGLLSYFMSAEKMDANEFSHLVNFGSGLLGVSETSPDMRDLLAHATSDVRAAEAVALFCYQVKKSVGAFAAALGGLDTLVFAGGIGERAPAVRARICEGLGFLGIELSTARNSVDAPVISTDESRVAVRVIRTDEEQMIAKAVCHVLGITIGRDRHEDN
jgi:acetate kinase